MNCQRAQRLCSTGSHPALSHGDRAALQDHLATCAQCLRQEQVCHALVTALRTLPPEEPTRDLFAQTQVQAKAEASLSSSVPWIENILLRRVRSAVAAAVVLLLIGYVLMGPRPKQAFGQEAFRRMQKSVLQAQTMHIVSWVFLPNEEEAKNGTWHEGKKPLRLEAWVTREAMGGSDTLTGPYLWTTRGYLHYDPDARKVQFARLEMSLQNAIKNTFNRISELEQSVPAGAYLSVKQLEDTRWKNRDVYRLRIASGPKKPASGEEIPLVHEPGKTPPISQGPHVRETFWVDKKTNLPVYSEYEKQIQQHWVIQRRTEYDYNQSMPSARFDPEAVRKAAEAFAAERQKKQ